MPVNVSSIATAVPVTRFDQAQIRDVFAGQPGLTRLGERLLKASFNASGIDQRHTVIEELDLAPRDAAPVFFDSEAVRILDPGTGVRNRVYIKQATPLFVEAARGALAGAAGCSPGDITHVVTVSCTGFFSPGPDYEIIRALGLNSDVQRYHLGFMGCCAALPALRMAKAFCDTNPEAVVLVVSAELCSLHVRVSNDPDTIVASSLFADGAAAALVSARSLGSGNSFRLDRFETMLTETGEDAMAWKIGDHGFEMVLSSYVPKIIEANIEETLRPLLGSDDSLAGLAYRDIEHWAIHPGGRSILDRVESALALSEEQLVPARETLRRYGNMSSATVLFVLKHILDLPAGEEPERVCAMAFGPGLTVETALLTKLPGRATGGVSGMAETALPATARA